MSATPVGVAVVGAGVISGEYLRNLTAYPDITVMGIADLETDRAKARADQFGVDTIGDIESVIGQDSVEIVVNLTPPVAHVDVTRAALQAGKHVYSEKPLAVELSDGEKLLNEAAESGLRIGCAPDTFLGAGLQSARQAIDAGVIGTPVSAAAELMTPGPDRWHPDPAFLFSYGAGPLFDLGPYYLTGLVGMLGPVQRVAALTRRARKERQVGSGPKAGTTFPVQVPTHVTALLDFASGPSATSTFSFDYAERRLSYEVTGTEGVIRVPDPNTFGGPLRLRKRSHAEWRDVPVTGDISGRGLGVLDMARSIRTNSPHRASGELALHVLELMCAIDDAGRDNRLVELKSSASRPEPLPRTWDPRAATL